jgi:hypothetical protein
MPAAGCDHIKACNTHKSPETYSGLRNIQIGEQAADKTRYQLVLGSLVHVAQCTRSDSYAGKCTGGFCLRALIEPSCSLVGCYTACGRDCRVWDFLWERQAAQGIQVRCKFCIVLGYPAEHYRLGGMHAVCMEGPCHGAVYYCGVNNGCGVSSLWSGCKRGRIASQGSQGPRLTFCFAVRTGRRGRGQSIETQLAILQGIACWVVSCCLCIVSLRST